MPLHGTSRLGALDAKQDDGFIGADSHSEGGQNAKYTGDALYCLIQFEFCVGDPLKKPVICICSSNIRRNMTQELL